MAGFNLNILENQSSADVAYLRGVDYIKKQGATIDKSRGEDAKTEERDEDSAINRSKTVDKERTSSEALISAVASDDLDEVKKLLEDGANVDAKDSKGRTALIIACADGKSAIAKWLIKKGANINANSRGLTPLIGAAFDGNDEVVELLLDKGANINAKTNNGVSAIEAAKQKGNSSVVKILRNAGAQE